MVAICKQATLNCVASSRANGLAHLHGRVVVPLSGIGSQHPWPQAGAVRGSSSINRSRIVWALSELVLQFSVMSFCPLEKGKRRRKEAFKSP
jgi:hypothetical protein